MKGDTVQALNYSAHAIEDLCEIESAIRTQMPESAQALVDVIDQLHNSVKFIMPNRCELLDLNELKQSNFDLVRLPYPCVAFEVPWESDSADLPDVGGFQQARATKRIALCWEVVPQEGVDSPGKSVLTQFPQGGVYVFPIYWQPGEGQTRWTTAAGGSFLPYGTQIVDIPLEETPEASRLANEARIAAGRAKAKSKQFRAEHFVLLPEFFERMVQEDGSVARARSRTILDSYDEVMVMIQACNVLNCSNVATVDLAASAPLNKKRVANGKKPFYSYKVLQVDEDKTPGAGSGKGGSHSSPRTHLRRGHLRRLETKTVWVKPSMINANSALGVVHKDYAIASKT